MITIDYHELKECIKEIDRSVRLITSLDDINLAEAIDNLYHIKSVLQSSLEDHEGFLQWTEWEEE